MANLRDLIVNGVSRFIGKVFINDSRIEVINNSTVGDNPKFTDTTYSAVGTSGNPGLMSTADKVKLNAIATSATRNTFSAITGNPTSNQTPSFGGTFNIYQVGQTTAGAITTTARTVKIPDTEATTAAHGLMTAADKIKINALTTADATTTAHGYLTAADKIKLNALSTVDNNTTYAVVTTAAAGLSPKLSGSATQYLNGTGNWTTPTNTTYADATTSAHGLLTAADKIKLNALTTADATTSAHGYLTAADKIKLNALSTVDNNTTYGLVTTAANGLAPKLSNSVTQYLNGQGAWTTPTNTTYADVTTAAHGLMTAADKKKLESIASSATRNTFSAFTGAPTSNQTPSFGGTFNIYQVGQTTAGAITTTARTVKIPNTAATTAAAGLMSAADKIKLNSLQYVKDGTNNSVLLGNVANNKATGVYSISEGHCTTASNGMAHAEGGFTEASGQAAHAEGYETHATSDYSHVEGNYTTASGISAHAEGSLTLASGDISHTEGNKTTASEFASHAEGNGTLAFGQHSHAEGTDTIAKFKSQHVFGEYNVADPSTSTSTSVRGTYIEIVGNGTTATRNNARTLDWLGNERLSGGLYANLNIHASGFNSYKWSANLFDSAYQTAFLGTAMSSIGEVNGHLFLYGNMTTATNSSTRSLLTEFGKITYTNSYGTLVDNQPAIRLYHTNGSDTSWLAANRGYISNGAFAGFMVYGKTPQHSYNMDWTTTGLNMYVDTTNIGRVTLTSSDARVKTDIKPLGEQYKNAISSLDFKEFKYDFKDPVRSEANGLKRFGVIAQDVIAALEEQGLDWKQSEIVETTENEDDTYYTINYVPFLITRLAADEDRIKQLEETIEKLTTRLDALEGK